MLTINCLSSFYEIYSVLFFISNFNAYICKKIRKMNIREQILESNEDLELFDECMDSALLGYAERAGAQISYYTTNRS